MADPTDPPNDASTNDDPTNDAPTPRHVAVALVLGAGGVVGGAYHAGALQALAEVAGWEARTAELIVGTSAGAGMASSLRAGFSAGDLYARALDEPMSAEGRERSVGVPDTRIPLPENPPPASWLRPTAPWLVVPAFLSRGPAWPGLVLGGVAPVGTNDTGPVGERARALHGDRWPDAPTWICATRLRDGKRVVFGRDDVDTPDLGRAVEASSAVPGLFRPVPIGRHRYLDGACWSPTNADLAAGLGFDLVIVVSPMSAVPGALRADPRLATRALHARLLAGEVAKLRARNTPVLVLQPTAAAIDAIGRQRRDDALATEVARQARTEVGTLLQRDELADRLGLLAMAPTSI